MTTPRRHFLHLCGVAGIGAFAGCTGSRGTDSTSTSAGTSVTDGTTPGTDTSKSDSTSTSTEASGGWTQQAMFTADDVAGGDGIGSSVAVSSDGTTAIVGAPLDSSLHRRQSGRTENSDGGETTTGNPNGRNAGTAYVFEASGESWRQQAKLTAEDGDSGDRLGVSVALSSDGTTAVIGAERFDDPNGVEAGKAYVFEASDGSWSQQTKLTPDDRVSGDNFGRTVALSGDGTTAVIGAKIDAESNVEKARSAYIFEASGESWRQQAKLTAEDGDSGDRFGRAVALSGDGTTALISAGLDEDPNGHFAGAAYVFEASGESWRQQAKLTAEDGDSEDAFGWSVAVSGDGTTAVIGAQTDEDPNGDQAGAAYVFETSGGSWRQQAKLAAEDGNRGDSFGRTVVVSSDGTTVLIGAEGDDLRRGSAYVFEASGESWRQQAKLTPDDRDKAHKFGKAVAVSSDGTTALIGSIDLNNPSGSAYVFTP